MLSDVFLVFNSLDFGQFQLIFKGSISLKATLRGQKAGKYFRGYICSSLWPRRILRKYYISFCSTHFKSCLAFWQLKGSLDDPQIKCLSGFSFKTASHSNMITSLIFPSSLIRKSFAAIFITEKKFPAQQVLPWVGNLISSPFKWGTLEQIWEV